MADQSSWREFFERYQRFIYGAARRKGLSHEDAEEVLQDTVVSVAKGLPSFVYRPEVSSFKSWLMTITKRRVTDQLRRSARQVPVVELDPASPSGEGGGIEPFEGVWEAEWEGNLLRTALDGLRLKVSPRDFQVFAWVYCQGRSRRETAKAFGVSELLIRVKTFRIRAHLAAEIRRLERQPWPKGAMP